MKTPFSITRPIKKTPSAGTTMAYVPRIGDWRMAAG
jgi:hypothetical protein